MKKVAGWVVFLVLVAGCVWFPLAHTVVRTDRQLFLIRKPEYTFKQVYVDVRGWTGVDFLNNKELTKALVARGFKDLKQKLKSE